MATTTTTKPKAKKPEPAKKMTAIERHRQQATARLDKAAKAFTAAEVQLEKTRDQRCAAIFKAHDEDELTYKEIAAVVGLTTVRVGQILSAMREDED